MARQKCYHITTTKRVAQTLGIGLPGVFLWHSARRTIHRDSVLQLDRLEIAR